MTINGHQPVPGDGRGKLTLDKKFNPKSPHSAGTSVAVAMDVALVNIVIPGDGWGKLDLRQKVQPQTS